MHNMEERAPGAMDPAEETRAEVSETKGEQPTTPDLVESREQPRELIRGGAATVEKHRQNEDAAIDLRFRDRTTGQPVRAYGVLDGASQGGRGAEAALIVKNALERDIVHFAPETRTDAAAAEAAVRDSFASIQEELRAMNAALGDKAGEEILRATTAALMLPVEDPATFAPSEVIIGAIGDSPVFRIRGGDLEQLTNDQTQAEEDVRALIAKGEFPAAALAYARGDRNAGVVSALSENQRGSIDIVRRFAGNNILAGFGVRESLPAQVYRERVEPGDFYLAASDGITKLIDTGKLTHADLVALAAEHRGDGAAFSQALIARVRELGPLDDTTVAAFGVGERAPAAEVPRAEERAVADVEPDLERLDTAALEALLRKHHEAAAAYATGKGPSRAKQEDLDARLQKAQHITEILGARGAYPEASPSTERSESSPSALATELADHEAQIAVFESRSGTYNLSEHAQPIAVVAPVELKTAAVQQDVEYRRQRSAVLRSALAARGLVPAVNDRGEPTARQLLDANTIATWEALAAEPDRVDDLDTLGEQFSGDIAWIDDVAERGATTDAEAASVEIQQRVLDTHGIPKLQEIADRYRRLEGNPEQQETVLQQMREVKDLAVRALDAIRDHAAAARSDDATRDAA